MEPSPSRPRWAVALYDRVYRVLHGLDRPESVVGPILRIEVCRSCWRVTLADGTAVRPGDRVGDLHINNDAIGALHADGASPMAVGLEFRRQLLASLQVLATLCRAGARFQDLRAYTATTIFHAGLLRRLGFEVEPGALLCPRIVAAYQRALLALLHPGGLPRCAESHYRVAHRLWISRQALVARYAPAAAAPEPHRRLA